MPIRHELAAVRADYDRQVSDAMSRVLATSAQIAAVALVHVLLVGTDDGVDELAHLVTQQLELFREAEVDGHGGLLGIAGARMRAGRGPVVAGAHGSLSS